jgi:hypothetical protein
MLAALLIHVVATCASIKEHRVVDGQSCAVVAAWAVVTN